MPKVLIKIKETDFKECEPTVVSILIKPYSKQIFFIWIFQVNIVEDEFDPC